MENDNKNCSSEKHKEVKAISYCHDCKVYLCNKCDIFHSELLKNHHSYKIDKDIPEQFSFYCNEKEHNQKLEFFCKNHNKLCCVSCLCKIKGGKYGQHTDCDICYIKDIKEEKKSNLKKNMKLLEDLSNNINEIKNKIKIIYEKINKEKEELKLKIQKLFTNIRNEINNREDQLLIEAENIYSNKYFKEEFINDIEKLPNKIKISLEKGKIVDKEWNNDEKINLIINDCITIENNINNINLINDKIKSYKNDNNLKINFYPKNEIEINSFLQKIKNFGKISNNNFNINSISKIADKEEYCMSLKNWIEPNKDLKFELLYRLSEHGEKFSKLHELCDNKGSTLTLFHVKDGNKVGIYTPLTLDNKSGWKTDMNTFIFNLNKNKKYKKLTNNCSLFCNSSFGIYTADFGNNAADGTLKKIKHFGNDINSIYENGKDILPIDGKEKSYILEEMEVFKISTIN